MGLNLPFPPRGRGVGGEGAHRSSLGCDGGSDFESRCMRFRLRVNVLNLMGVLSISLLTAGHAGALADEPVPDHKPAELVPQGLEIPAVLRPAKKREAVRRIELQPQFDAMRQQL